MKTSALLALAFSLALPAAAATQAAEPTVEDLIQKKCSLCHTGHRIYSSDPAKIKDLVERMERKNPDWFKDTDKGHLVAGLAKLLNDPQIVARRKDWEASVERGKVVFADTLLGTTGKSCASCHQPEALRGVSEKYPAYDVKLGRHVGLQEKLQGMIVTKLAGPQIPLGDPRTVGLEVYLKSLR